jgi:hypothetical protein
MINSKRKGSAAERAACKFLEQWTGVKGFSRVPLSGGARWSPREESRGDVIAPKGLFFPFTVEVKSVRDCRLTFYPGKSNIFSRAYEQCARDCARTGKMPMLLVRENGLSQGFFMMCVEADSVRVEALSAHALIRAHSGARLRVIPTTVLLAEAPYERFLEGIKKP